MSTVYHHFPNREAQIEAMAEFVERRIGRDEPPESLADLPAYGRRRAQTFREHEALLRAQLAPGVAAQVRARRRKRRAAAIDRCVRDAGASAEDTKLVAAVLKHLVSADPLVALLDRQGLSHDEAERVLVWVVELVTRALARGEGPTSKKKTR